MSDMPDAEMLENRVKLLLECSLSTGHADTIYDLFDELFWQTREKQATIEKLTNPWISVEGRLPTEDDYDSEGYVFVRMKDGVTGTDRCDTWTSDHHPEYTGWGLDSWGDPIVTHWMPIPEQGDRS